jgi:hypothetical protein
MYACTKLLESGADLDFGLSDRAGCPLEVRKSDIRNQLARARDSGDLGALEHIVNDKDMPDVRDLVVELSKCKDMYDEGDFEGAVTRLTHTIDGCISGTSTVADLAAKERVALGACYALRGQCYEELGGPGSRQQAAQDYTAAIELDGEGADVEHDLDVPMDLKPTVAVIQAVMHGEMPVASVTERSEQLPTPKPVPPNGSKTALMGPPSNKPQKRAAKASAGGGPGKGKTRGKVSVGSVVGSHTPAFHPLTSTHGRYPRVPLAAVMPPSPRAAKIQRAAEAARVNGNGANADGPVCPARPDVQAGWDRPSTAPAHMRGTFGTSYTVPAIPAQSFSSRPRTVTPAGVSKTAASASAQEAGQTDAEAAAQLAEQQRSAAMARLFPRPVADFKAPALKGRNMKEAAQALPEGHFAVGGRVYKIADNIEADDGEQRDVGVLGGSSESMKAFLERKQPDAVPPWHSQEQEQRGNKAAQSSRPGTAPDTPGRRRAYAQKQQRQQRGSHGRAQQLGAFGSGRSSEAGAGGRPWSPAEEPVHVDLRAMSKPASVSRKQVERGGWMWRPFSQGGPIVAAFGTHTLTASCE